MKVLSLSGIQTDRNLWAGAYSIVPSDHTFVEGETDVTSIDTLQTMFRLGRCDYKRLRTGLTLYVAGVGFSSLSAADKAIAARYFVVSEADRLSVFTREEMSVHGAEFHAQSCATRRTRLEKAEAVLYAYFALADVHALTELIQATTVREDYVEFGIETLAGDGKAGLYDWVQATSGTAYSATGFAALSYTPVEGTLASVVTRIMEILTTGQ
jgi:hypothetical protein